MNTPNLDLVLFAMTKNEIPNVDWDALEKAAQELLELKRVAGQAEALRFALDAAGACLFYTSAGNLPLLTHKQLQDKVVGARSIILDALREHDRKTNLPLPLDNH